MLIPKLAHAFQRWLRPVSSASLDQNTANLLEVLGKMDNFRQKECVGDLQAMLINYGVKHENIPKNSKYADLVEALCVVQQAAK